MEDLIRKQFLAALSEKKMDPVGHEDGDVDNDGDEDESDQYILNRRKAIKKAIQKEEAKLDQNDSYYAYQDAKDKYQKDNPGKDFERAPEHHKQKYIHPEMKKRGFVKSGSRWVREEVDLDEGIFGAGLGAGLGKMVGDNLAKSAGSLATKAAKSVASKSPVYGKLATDALGGADKIGKAVTKYTPAAGAAVGAVAGHKATRRNRREDVDYDEFAPLTEAEELFIEENQDLVFEAVSELLYEENIDWQELTEEELNELIGRMARAINNRIGITRAGRTERDKRKAQKTLDKAVAIRQRTQAKQDRRDANRELRRAKAGAKDNNPRAIMKKRSSELKQRRAASKQKEADVMSKARETRMAQFRSSRS